MSRSRYPTSPSSCSSDDSTLHEEPAAALFPPRRRDSLTAWSESDNDEHAPAPPPPLFPFHLIAGCSTAERAMCQISQTLTAAELQGGRIGLKGTLVDVDMGDDEWAAHPRQPRSGWRWTLNGVPSLLRMGFPHQYASHATCLDATCVEKG
jgi:hypothetical protein